MKEDSGSQEGDTSMLRRERFCWECNNFEDRANIDENVLCVRGHSPRISCNDFVPKFKNPPKLGPHTKFCSECQNFEDRGHIDETVLCVNNHRPGSTCEDFAEKCRYACAQAVQCYYGWCSSCNRKQML
jgi:hypothetical protein